MSLRGSLRVFCALVVAFAVGAPSASAQQSSEFLTAIQNLRQLNGSPAQIATVSDLTLERDAGRFVLKDGKLHLLTLAQGRVFGAVFLGQGTFTFTPPSAMERGRLRHFEKSDTLTAPFTDLVLFFTDSTLAQLRRRLKFGGEDIPDRVYSRVRKAVEYLGDEDTKQFDPDLIGAVLNGPTEGPGLFYAHVERRSGGPLMFSILPDRNEAVSLERPIPERSAGRHTEVISQFPLAGDTARAETYSRRPVMQLPHYQMRVWLDNSLVGDVAFRAEATVDLVATEPIGPWVPLGLFEKARVDSAYWSDGRPAVVFKGKESQHLWVNLGARLGAGDTRRLSLFYRGDLIDRRLGDWFYIKSHDWYPTLLDGRGLATFDLTFDFPRSFVLASIGELVDSTTADRRTTTRWVTRRPAQFASFNVGRFKQHEIVEAGLPPITVLYSEDVYKVFKRVLLAYGAPEYGPQRNMKDAVGSDVLNSMKFFRQVFGEPAFARFYATETPYFHGVAFPGLVHLSWTTFLQTQSDGSDEWFRAHEVAHQWWGIGVDYTTYHEQWLSEGFASFAGLWYLQTARKENKKYFAMLDRWRTDIMSRVEEPAPIWLGWRNSTGGDHNGYNVIVYQKGAWVLHMLRMMMLDLNTMNEDRFTETMRDFYRTYQGKRATTDDFRRVVERHAGSDMGWFFQQWVYDSRMPTYRVQHRTSETPDGKFRVHLKVRQENVPESFLSYVLVTLDLGKAGKVRFRVKVKGPETTIALPLVAAAPKEVKFNDLESVLGDVRVERAAGVSLVK